MARNIIILVALLLGMALGALGYHVYLLERPQAARPYVAGALEWAEREVDSETIRSYVRQVLLAVEVAKLESAPQPGVSQCAIWFEAANLTTPLGSRVSQCTVTIDADRKATVVATSRSGESFTMGPW